MATKKPSAAQIAARKLFAQRAKAGYFGKPAAKRKTRRRNPQSGKDHDIGMPGWDDMDEERDRNPVKRSGHSRNANNLARSGHSRDSRLSRSRSGPNYGPGRIDPKGHGERVKRLRNPMSPPTNFTIHRADADGKPSGVAIASAKAKPDAVAIGKMLAAQLKRPIVIVGKK